MSDPRERLDRGTLVRVRTTEWKDRVSLFPRTTQTPLDQARLVKVEGLYQPQDQSPTIEGELVVVFAEEYGERTAQNYVAVDINGTLEWKVVNKSRSTGDGATGGAF